ncbi:hypothetical protein K443DRAFT_389951 [Laccaria amethystina LaAM-08-1]|uniref:Uncharacterized protein n=1 Tax=Laccaria amethystina LaAM-08-1 TaxID=1095629 RepID=A0A0C9Y6E7_9AGAR|nr:hypothetical protein K443DRAFT_389951 [Laccaria amethystina LaAM-08-1]
MVLAKLYSLGCMLLPGSSYFRCSSPQRPTIVLTLNPTGRMTPYTRVGKHQNHCVYSEPDWLRNHLALKLTTYATTVFV